MSPARRARRCCESASHRRTKSFATSRSDCVMAGGDNPERFGRQYLAAHFAYGTVRRWLLRHSNGHEVGAVRDPDLPFGPWLSTPNSLLNGAIGRRPGMVAGEGRSTSTRAGLRFPTNEG